ncbi:MAG: double zinc ribbon domain-containing protein [Clostridiales Family XIII bacterium]|nr:double zinc ribbon domain-containing protein [Clostridiales Family XIII bacterium]
MSGLREEAAGRSAPAADFLKRAARIALDLLYPPSIYCMACGNLIDASRPYSLCDACRERFGWANGDSCAKCGRPLHGGGPQTLCADCAGGGHLFEKGFACVEYADCRAVLYGFKYGGRTYYGEHIARVMHDRLLWEGRAQTEPANGRDANGRDADGRAGGPANAPAHGAPRTGERSGRAGEPGTGGLRRLGVDLLLPVPMYAKKERKRGYNQADIAGRLLARLLAVPYDGKLLERIRDTHVMSNLSAEERGANVKGAFALARDREDAVRGLRVMLADDIYTTGSTLDACAEALLAAGAASVRFIVFAATGAGADAGAGDLRGVM